jgi:enoyl-CoA hydratase
MRPEIRTRTEGNVSVVTLDAPTRRNALSQSLLRDLCDALTLEVKGNARAIVLTGGEDCFSAGADLRELTGSLRDLELDEAVANTAEVVRQLSVPVIAAIEGPCIGAAIEVVVACDVRVAGQSAFFELPATRLGLLYRPGALVDLAGTLPRQTLNRLLLIGERLSADEALAAGLVGVMVSDGEAEEAAIKLGARSSQGVREAVAATKDLLRRIGSGRVDSAAWERRRRELLTSDSRLRALRAAQERRSKS